MHAAKDALQHKRSGVPRTETAFDAVEEYLKAILCKVFA
jgi:hypothetical protein